MAFEKVDHICGDRFFFAEDELSSRAFERRDVDSESRSCGDRDGRIKRARRLDDLEGDGVVRRRDEDELRASDSRVLENFVVHPVSLNGRYSALFERLEIDRIQIDEADGTSSDEKGFGDGAPHWPGSDDDGVRLRVVDRANKRGGNVFVRFVRFGVLGGHAEFCEGDLDHVRGEDEGRDGDEEHGVVRRFVDSLCAEGDGEEHEGKFADLGNTHAERERAPLIHSARAQREGRAQRFERDRPNEREEARRRMMEDVREVGQHSQRDEEHRGERFAEG